MARLEWSRRASADLERLDTFLRGKSPRADTALSLIVAAAHELSTFPALGRPFQHPDDAYREFVVRYSNSGYLILYRHEGDAVEILAIRHQSEDGY